jgi:aryl-alcohol dehydrogenase-like predicted oxidoreductase
VLLISCYVEQDIVKTAFEAGINMFDTAEEYSGGKSEEEL